MRLILLLTTLAIAGLQAGCVTASVPSTNLDGVWVVTAGEHEGQKMDVVVGGKLTLQGDRFSIRTASGNELRGSVQTTTDQSPARIDFLLDTGARWQGIYEIANDSLRINYVDVAGNEPRPVHFRTSGDTEASLLILQRLPS